MNRLLVYFSNRPLIGLAVILIVSLLSATQIGELKVRISAEEMLVQHDQEHIFYNRIRELFGDEQVILIYLESDRLLAPDKLKRLKRVLDEIAGYPFVERVESLFNIPWVKTVDGYLDKKPYLEKLPQTPEEEARILEEARKNPFLRHVLVSPDRNIMAAAVIMANDDGETEWNDEEITSRLETAVAGLKEDYDPAFAIGFPQVRSEIVQRIRSEQAHLFPLAIGALLIALFLLLRQLIDILLPILSAGFSILWTLGFMAATGIPLNVVTSIIPILLVIVGSTEDIHLLSEFRQGQRQGLKNKAALKHMARRMGSIVLLTFVTTYLGFLSVGLSRIEVLWQFGLVASTGLLFNFVATIILIPSVLALAGKWQLDGKAKIYGEKSRRLAKNYWNALWKHRKVVIGLFVLATIIAIAGIPRIHINHNAIDSLGENSPVRKQIELVNQNLAGLESLSIVVESGIEDTFLKVRYLEELEKLQNFIRDRGWSRSSTSFADYLSLLNGAFQELDESIMPESDDVVTELMIFLKHDEVKAYVTKDYSEARILVRHAIDSSEKLKKVLAQLQHFIDENLDPGLTAAIHRPAAGHHRAHHRVALHRTPGGPAGDPAQFLPGHRHVRLHGVHGHSAEHRHHHGCGHRYRHRRGRHAPFHAALQPGTQGAQEPRHRHAAHHPRRSPAGGLHLAGAHRRLPGLHPGHFSAHRPVRLPRCPGDRHRAAGRFRHHATGHLLAAPGDHLGPAVTAVAQAGAGEEPSVQGPSSLADPPVHSLGHHPAL